MKRTPAQNAFFQTGIKQNVVAEKLGVKLTTFSRWVRLQFPAERCADIERATNGAIRRGDLRPDLFADAPPLVIVQPSANERHSGWHMERAL